MIVLKEEFKSFVKKRPELIKYVNSGEMTWQKFYEQWSLYGEDEKVWSKYQKEEMKKQEGLNLNGFAQIIKNIDMNQVQKGVNSLQKMVELLQGLSFKETSTNSSSYTPRQLFKKFED